MDEFLSTRHALETAVMFLTIHDSLLTARGRQGFFFFSMVSNAVDTMCFLYSAPNVNVARNSNNRG